MFSLGTVLYPVRVPGIRRRLEKKLLPGET